MGEEYRGARSIDMSPASFSWFVMSAIEDASNIEVISELKQLFNGKVVIDIGPGDNTGGYKIAEMLGARAYIAVEPYFANNLVRELSDKINADEKLPYVVLNTDASNALSSMIEGSANIMSIGTDSTMIRDKDYRKQVNKLLHEKLGPNVFMGSETVFHPEQSKELFRFYSHRGEVGITEVYRNE